MSSICLKCFLFFFNHLKLPLVVMICCLLLNSLLQITFEPTNWQDEFRQVQSKDSMIVYFVVSDRECQSDFQQPSRQKSTSSTPSRDIQLSSKKIALNQTKAIKLRNSLTDWVYFKTRNIWFSKMGATRFFFISYF